MSKQLANGMFQGKNFQCRFRQTLLVIKLFVLVALLAACNPQKGTSPTVVVTTEDEQVVVATENVQEEGGKKNEECPQLNSKLYELSLMEDPIPTAEQWGFRVKDDRVFVLLVLADELTEIPDGFDLEVGTRLGDQVQVFVPFDELCCLANSDEVVAIRQPIEPVLE